MKNYLWIIFIFFTSHFAFGKAINPDCIGVTGATFTKGSGTATDPYLICNKTQYQLLGSELTLRNKSFILGSDLIFKTTLITRIGRQNSPFTGSFDGDNYTLSFISLAASPNLSHIGMFGYLKDARVSNLILSNFKVIGGGQNIGSVAGVAENSTIENVHAKSITLPAPKRTGGLIGTSIDSVIQKSSSEGMLNLSANSNSIGGLIGFASGSTITTSYSNVKLFETATNISSALSSIGGLIGELKASNVQNTYAIGDIDFSNVTSMTTMPQVGGLLGVIGYSIISKSFYAGKIIDVDGINVGGAVGYSVNPTWDNVVWDMIVSGISSSALGEIGVTCLMKQTQFWLNHEFDTTIWALIDGSYPKFIWQG